MKITKARLKEMIREELKESVRQGSETMKTDLLMIYMSKRSD